MRLAVRAGAFVCFCGLQTDPAGPGNFHPSFQTSGNHSCEPDPRRNAWRCLHRISGHETRTHGCGYLGILKNANGPKGDIILNPPGGTKPSTQGVVAGMSGSPVYLDSGVLAGALSFRIESSLRSRSQGVTPIAEMLEINALDNSPGTATC